MKLTGGPCSDAIHGVALVTCMIVGIYMRFGMYAKKKLHMGSGGPRYIAHLTFRNCIWNPPYDCGRMVQSSMQRQRLTTRCSLLLGSNGENVRHVVLILRSESISRKVFLDLIQHNEIQYVYILPIFIFLKKYRHSKCTNAPFFYYFHDIHIH